MRKDEVSNLDLLTIQLHCELTLDSDLQINNFYIEYLTPLLSVLRLLRSYSEVTHRLYRMDQVLLFSLTKHKCYERIKNINQIPNHYMFKISDLADLILGLVLNSRNYLTLEAPNRVILTRYEK
ncbi:hypothetical protein BpHYR1_048331 [Brachionus plicatilis]|uniref:Uncharacterized protein n=1 Tax=Brachionus plicatilis TaxID=10195 RepID=A0A3M7PDZ8_BRAPC|nr:hypothetical protein BpHYR1_048331 [Brachionus plicatilis]